MLVLTRKTGESLMIGDEIEIKVIEIAGDKVKIGIEAPDAVRILRKELLQTISSNQQAAQAAPEELIKFLKGFGW